MPRNTPVRELQKEEPVPSSPLRRSSRLNNSSPVPTKVITRRNSASETPVSTPAVTRGRRSSFSQESKAKEDLQADKKKTTSTIRTRKSSLTQNNDDQAQTETVKTRARSTSKEPEQIPEVKKTTRRRRSITDDAENDQDAAKKVTRSRSSSLSKKNEIMETKSANKKQSFSSMDVPASTPIKKSPSSHNTSDTLDPIEEDNKEVESPSGTPSKKPRKRITEVSKVDFDLSVINEGSITEEETTPQKKSTSMDKVEDQSEKTSARENDLDAEKKEDTSNAVSADETVKQSAKAEPELDTVVAEEDLADKKISTTEKHDSSVSDASFNLQLSPLENSQNKTDTNNKENISPKESKCEPMEVDEVLQESSPAVKKLLKSPKVTTKVDITVVEKELQAIVETTDKMVEFLNETVLSNSQTNKKGNIRDELVLADTTEEANNDTENLKEDQSEKNNAPENNFEVEKNQDASKELSTTETIKQSAKDEPEVDNEILKQVEKNRVSTTLEEEVEKSNSTEINMEEQSTGTGALPLSSDDTECREVSEQTAESVKSSPSEEQESNATDNTPQKISTEEDEHNISNAPKEKSPSKTPSKVISNTRKSDLFQEQAPLNESLTSKDGISDISVGPDVNDESVMEVEEPSPVKEKQPVQKDTEKEEVVNVEESSSDTDKTAVVVTLTEKEHVIVSDQKESSVSQQIKVEEIVTVNDSDTDEDVDLEVKTINESKTVVSERRSSEGKNSVNLCDSDTSEEDESGNAPKVKESKTCHSVSDDEIFISKKERNKKKSIDKLLERSIDSKYMITTPGKTQKAAEKSLSVSSSELVEDQESEVFNETSVSDESVDVSQTEKAEPVGKQYDKIKEEKKDVFNGSASSIKRHSLDRRSITLQETIKAGDDPEQKLSGHIHKVVDLFCASIKNKTDLSINVSMEYAEHVSDSEDDNDKTDVVNISLTACNINEKEVEPVKGSKRRKICDVKSPEKSHSEDEEESMDESPHDLSQDSSVVTNDEEKVSSAKKRKKRKSDASQGEKKAVKTPPRVSFAADTEDKNKKTKKRKSTSDISESENELSEQKEPKISPVKKPVPLTPFKASKTNQSEEDSESAEASSDDDEENNEGVSRNYHDLFSVSFAESDANDTTWKLDEEVESEESESEIADSDIDEEETLLDESSPIIDTSKKRRKSNSRSSSEETSQLSARSKKASQSGSSGSVDDVFTDSVNEKEEDISKNKKRKLFRLSKIQNLSHVFASSETEDNVNTERTVSIDKIKKQSTDPALDRKKSKNRNKKLKQTFSSQTVDCMLPETSEMQEKPIKMGRKRRRPNLQDEEEQPMKITVKDTHDLVSKKMKDLKKKRELSNVIRPSASNIKNLKPLRMKPSTKIHSGWDVTAM